ncbi:MAG: TM2 domain-containing protein [Clostridia bacterium]|nr:TM2 domain-containing protein [Clostridia bacterium]
MQLGTYQSIFKNRFSNNYAFYNSLCSEAWFNECRIGNQGGSSSNYSQPQKPAEFVQKVPYAAEQPKKQFSAPKQKAEKSRLVAALLALFAGGIGIHHFYVGKWVKGVLSIVFCWTYIPSIVGFIEGLMMLFMSDEKFALKLKK